MGNKYQYKVQGVDYDVEIAEVEGNIAKVTVNGVPFEVEMLQPINAAKHPNIVKSKVAAPAAPSSPAPRQAAQPAAVPASAPVAAGNPLKAPLPGTISSVLVKVGDTVQVGDVVVVLEAMKMQNNIEAEYAGTVTSVNVSQGDAVMEGSVMLTIG